MIPTLDPVVLLREAWQKSRLLRVAAIVACLSLVVLALAAVRGRIAWTITLFLVLCNFGVWYFALSMKSAFAQYRRWSKTPLADRMEAIAEGFALITIGSSQGLFLIMVLRLWEHPAG